MKKILLGSAFLFSFHFCHSQSATLDPTFGTKGIVKTDMGASFSYSNTAKQVLVTPTGELYVLLNGNFPGTVVSKRLTNGSIDSTYGLNGYSASIAVTEAFAAVQPDGKIVVAGAAGNTSFVTTRLSADGKPDSTFGTNATQTTDLGGASSATSVAIQSDGKIIVAGYTNVDPNTYFALVRYNANGSLDNTFNGTGQALADFVFKIAPEVENGDSIEVHNSFALSVRIQSDGKIVAGGYAATGDGQDFAVARFNADGTPDNTFDSDGKQTSDFGSIDVAYSVAIQTDGKILLAGYTAGGASNVFAVARYNTDGSPDNSFNGNGKQTAPVESDIQIGNAMALQSNGKILVAGYTLSGDNNDFATARFNTDGSLDNSFDGDGIMLTDLSSFSDDYAGSIAVQSDDKIVVAGYSYIYAATTLQQIALIRYNADGSFDNTFANNGILAGDSQQGSTYYNATALQANGKVIAVGRTWNGTDYDFAVVRYNNNGSLDNTFSNDGKMTIDMGATDEAVSLAIQPDGKILVAGNSGNQFALARLNSDGTNDISFNGNGKLITLIGSSDELKSIAVQADGKIVAAGFAYTDDNFDSAYFAVARFNADGTVDNGFNGNGTQLTEFGTNSNFATSVSIQNNGKIVVAGRSYINDQNTFSLVRYNADGSLDNTFSGDGKQTSVFGSDGYNIQSMAIQSDGKIVVGGYSETLDGSSTSFAAARYLATGELDNSFGESGFQSANLGPNFNFGKSIAINSNGRIAVAGTNGDYAIVLFKSDGTRDSTFGNNGILTTKVGLGGSSIQGIAFLNDNLYAAGSGQFPGNFGVVARYSFAEGGPLPVSLLDFKAILQNKEVALQWQVTSEKDLSGFTVLRSPNGITFAPIGFVSSKGNSSTTVTYSLLDRQPLPGINFYRLQMIDRDGKSTYSKIVSVNLKSRIFTLQVYPNPVQNTLFVNANGENEKASFQLIDASGKKIQEVNLSLNGNTFFSIPVNNLPKGMYYLQLNTPTKTETKTFIKQ